MTHDELLTKIRVDYAIKNTHWIWLALRAVVELHKPWESTYDNLVMCDHCCSEIYPCPTLKAIQKELAE